MEAILGVVCAAFAGWLVLTPLMIVVCEIREFFRRRLLPKPPERKPEKRSPGVDY